MGNDIRQRLMVRETKVSRSGSRLRCFGLKLPARLVKVDLLPPKFERFAAFPKSHFLHAGNYRLQNEPPASVSRTVSTR